MLYRRRAECGAAVPPRVWRPPPTEGVASGALRRVVAQWTTDGAEEPFAWGGFIWVLGSAEAAKKTVAALLGAVLGTWFAQSSACVVACADALNVVSCSTKRVGGRLPVAVAMVAMVMAGLVALAVWRFAHRRACVGPRKHSCRPKTYKVGMGGRLPSRPPAPI